ncbi:MAG: FkbM family methyltransferase [Pseudomonadota bacterium]
MARLILRVEKLLRALVLLACGRVGIGGRGYRLPRGAWRLVRAAAALPHYEPDVKAILRRLLRQRDGAVLDVGANVGQTLLCVLEIDPARRYVGAEPQATATAGISAFLGANRMHDHTILTIGLSDDDGFADLGLSHANDLAASIHTEFRPEGFYATRMPVPVFRGDTVLAALDSPAVGVIKIDVEGAEHLVLAGLNGTIARDRPHIVFELLPDVLMRDGSALDGETIARREEVRAAIAAFFAGHDYTYCLVAEDGTLDHRAALAPAARRIRNYVAVPSEMLEDTHGRGGD